MTSDLVTARAATVAAALLAMLASAAPSARPVVVSLDGTRFEGETGETGKGEHHRDTLTFDQGRFRSLDCERWGFGSAPYTATREDGVIRFHATLRSDDRGTLEWDGTIRGDVAEASFRWRHERWYWDIDRQYWFRGTRVGAR